MHKHKGIYWDKRKQRWHARFYIGKTVNGKSVRFHIGRFKLFDDAVAAYDKVAKRNTTNAQV